MKITVKFKSLLETANLIFLSLTVYSLVKHWRSTAQLLHTETKTHFGIIFKLFLITGIMKQTEKWSDQDFFGVCLGQLGHLQHKQVWTDIDLCSDPKIICSY